MEQFSVFILLSIIAVFIIYGVRAALRRKDDFWQDKPRSGKRGRGVRDRSRS